VATVDVVLRPEGMPADVADERVRSAAAAIVQSWDGLGYASSGEVRDAYTQLLFPHDAPATATAMAATMSSCALVGMALYRALGVVHRELESPYARRIGFAVAIVGIVASEHGARQAATAWSPRREGPRIGDVVQIGRNGDARWARGGVSLEHVACVFDREGDVLHSVDGGQGPKGVGIAIRSRRLVEVPARGGAVGELWLAALEAKLGADGRPTIGRRVATWADVTRLRLDRPARVPDTWSGLEDEPPITPFNAS
jgi:hypothetical protein